MIADLGLKDCQEPIPIPHIAVRTIRLLFEAIRPCHWDRDSLDISTKVQLLWVSTTRRNGSPFCAALADTLGARQRTF
jgi:hypothetical protein